MYYVRSGWAYVHPHSSDEAYVAMNEKGVAKNTRIQQAVPSAAAGAQESD
jgi:hypothetical protein